MKVHVVMRGFGNTYGPPVFDMGDAKHVRVVVTDMGNGQIKTAVRECDEDGARIVTDDNGGKHRITPEQEMELEEAGSLTLRPIKTGGGR